MKKPLFKSRLTLFWRLFFSLLLTILFTVISSVLVERWLNERALNARMEVQVERLLAKREVLITALEKDDWESVRRLYQQDRRFMNQIIIYEAQGGVIFPKYGRMRWHKNHVPTAPTRSFTPPDDIIDPKASIKEAVIRLNDHPDMADTTVTLPDGQAVVIQIRPNLPFDEIAALQRSNFMVRLVFIILFSTLISFWLSRTMIGRMRDVQRTVRQLIDGNYQTDPAIAQLGYDELGLLAKDVALLSTRLKDSELARKQMLSDISHELRSPLARLEVATELTRDFAPSAERYLDRIDKESARMNELIEQIIHIQSLQMQHYALDDAEKVPVNLVDIISEIGQDVCFEFQNKHVRWGWHPPMDTHAYVTHDNPEQLHSALENIIRNAFIHTPAGSTVTADIAKTTTDQGAPAIQIRITDAGDGVADEDLTRIFEPFVRLDSARQRQTGGYGLGLAIVHAVIKAHNGHIHACNRQDGQHGLVVQITLPALA